MSRGRAGLRGLSLSAPVPLLQSPASVCAGSTPPTANVATLIYRRQPVQALRDMINSYASLSQKDVLLSLLATLRAGTRAVLLRGARGHAAGASRGSPGRGCGAAPGQDRAAGPRPVAQPRGLPPPLPRSPSPDGEPRRGGGKATGRTRCPHGPF